jgi:hypothetical protein
LPRLREPKPPKVQDTSAPPVSDLETADPAVELREAENRARERAQAAATQDVQREHAIVQRQREQAQVVQAQLADAHTTTLDNALLAVDLESDAAMARHAEALARGDYAGAAHAQREMIQIEARRATMQAGLDELRPPQDEPPPQVQHVREGAVHAPAQLPPQPQYQQPPAAPPVAPPAGGNVEAVLAQLPNLMPQERDWLRSHPETIMQRQRELDATFRLAEAKGIPRGSPQYFEFFNQQFGYSNGRAAPAVEQTDPRHQQASEDDYLDEPSVADRRRVAAPVSHGSVPGMGNTGGGNRVVLTPDQREAARLSGISEVEYAQGVVRLREAKRQGLYQ